MMKRLIKISLLAALTCCLMNSANAQPQSENLLPNSNFEKPLPPQNTEVKGLPTGWTAYSWGLGGNKKFEVVRQTGAGRDGSIAVLSRNIDANANAGIFTHVPLVEGTYDLSVWARAEKGKTAEVRVYLANAYSPIHIVNDQWQQIHFSTTVVQLEGASSKGREINIQNTSNDGTLVWFDNAVLTKVPNVKYQLTPDTRPDRPRTVLLSTINVNYLHDTASDWAKRGFRGFMLTGVMMSQDDDAWAADGDPATQGDADALLKAVRSCNQTCKKVGIDSNFIYLGLRKELPDPFDDAAWEKLTRNFREGARFARLSECVGMAIDTEYVAQQYQPSWLGYAKNPHPLPELKAKIKQRWTNITAAMLKEFPNMVLLTLPEGIPLYGELYQDLFEGMLSAMAQEQAPGGMHVFTETTYHMTDIGGLGTYAKSVQSQTQNRLPTSLLPYWKSHCSVALGAWPLGYYRSIFDKEGKQIGYSGRKEVFGDEVVGSYADKSAWYSPEVFKTQMAGMNTFSPRYNWIYAHGDVFWQWTEAQKKYYESIVSNRIGNVLLPTAPNLDEYFEVLAHPQLVEPQ